MATIITRNGLELRVDDLADNFLFVSGLLWTLRLLPATWTSRTTCFQSASAHELANYSSFDFDTGMTDQGDTIGMNTLMWFCSRCSRCIHANSSVAPLLPPRPFASIFLRRLFGYRFVDRIRLSRRALLFAHTTVFLLAVSITTPLTTWCGPDE